MLEIICVALVVYFESRGEIYEGQQDVASVVWNRKEDPRWPSNSCEVAKQPKQFAVLFWPEDQKAWKQALSAAITTQHNPTTEAVFFATPGHHKDRTYLHTTGNHEFFL